MHEYLSVAFDRIGEIQSAIVEHDVNQLAIELKNSTNIEYQNLRIEDTTNAFGEITSFSITFNLNILEITINLSLATQPALEITATRNDYKCVKIDCLNASVVAMLNSQNSSPQKVHDKKLRMRYIVELKYTRVLTRFTRLKFVKKSFVCI